jgi:acetyl esterase/lipase
MGTSSIRAVLLLAVCLAPAAGQVQPTHGNLAYGTHARQKLDLYLPVGGLTPRSLVIWIHGGGWQGGDKYPCNHAPSLLAGGFAIASINYRLSGDATFPAQIHDCRAAVRWLRAHAAEYGLDPRRVGSWGSSAGGHLSAMLGTAGDVASLEGSVGGNVSKSSRVQAAADWFGPSNLFTMYPSHDACNSPESRLIGQCLGEIKAHLDDPAWQAWAQLLRAASPVFHVSRDDPPFHIAHGTADPVVPPGQSQELHDALVTAQVPSTVRYVEGAGHGLPASEVPPVVAFFQAQLAAPPVRPGDLDGDLDVDGDDLELFAGCATRSHVVYWPSGLPAGCPLTVDVGGYIAADLDRDRDVDLNDFGLFQACVSGEGTESNVRCAD